MLYKKVSFIQEQNEVLGLNVVADGIVSNRIEKLQKLQGNNVYTCACMKKPKEKLHFNLLSFYNAALATIWKNTINFIPSKSELLLACFDMFFGPIV